MLLFILLDIQILTLVFHILFSKPLDDLFSFGSFETHPGQLFHFILRLKELCIEHWMDHISIFEVSDPYLLSNFCIII